MEIAGYAKVKEAWFRGFLELPKGIPSHDTFGRVFALLDPNAFGRCYRNWVCGLIHIPDELAAVDGKTVRCSRDHANGKPAIHMVNAWAVHHGLVLGQVKTDAKSNEIKAIPELLKTMDLNGCVVTIDAMGCQKEIAEDVVGQGADYVFSLKGNQGNLHEEKDNWAKLKSFGMVESERDIDGHVSVETRYYILSLPSDTKRFAVAARGHWAVEKQPPLVSGHCFP